MFKKVNDEWTMVAYEGNEMTGTFNFSEFDVSVVSYVRKLEGRSFRTEWKHSG